MKRDTTALVTKPAITQLLTYHITEDHLPTSFEVARKEGVLLILGVGGLNYVPVSYRNGATVTISIINAVTTAILGEILLYTSGDIYYKIKIKPQYVDERLVEIIEAPLTPDQFIREVAIQSFAAAASAVPLATTLFDADLGIFAEYPELFWSALTYIEIVNTAMHLVPIELTMNDEFYSFLPLLLPRFLAGSWRLITHYQASAEEQTRTVLLEVRKNAWEDNLDPLLNSTAPGFFANLFSKEYADIRKKLAAYQHSPHTLYEEMLAPYVATPPLNPITKAMARVSGGLLVSLACLGYAANPYLVFKNDFHFSEEAALGITILPIYFFMVLMFFFGDGMGVRLLQDILSLKDITNKVTARLLQDESSLQDIFLRCKLVSLPYGQALVVGKNAWQEKLPLEAKFYPTAFAISMAVTVFSMCFTGAPGCEMMKNAYADVFPEWAMLLMFATVYIGIGGLLTFYALLDFTKIMLNLYAQYLGAGKVNDIAIIRAKFYASTDDFKRIKPELAEDLKDYMRSLVKKTAELDKLDEFRKQAKVSWCAFLKPVPQDEGELTKKLLSPADENHDGP
jgi:hypothetical protein